MAPCWLSLVNLIVDVLVLQVGLILGVFCFVVVLVLRPWTWTCYRLLWFRPRWWGLLQDFVLLRTSVAGVGISVGIVVDILLLGVVGAAKL